jgi:hypothetical protein
MCLHNLSQPFSTYDHHGSQSWTHRSYMDRTQNKPHTIMDLLKLAQPINKTLYVYDGP